MAVTQRRVTGGPAHPEYPAARGCYLELPTPGQQDGTPFTLTVGQEFYVEQLNYSTPI